jgi:hypothetical protein
MLLVIPQTFIFSSFVAAAAAVSTAESLHFKQEQRQKTIFVQISLNVHFSRMSYCRVSL